MEATGANYCHVDNGNVIAVTFKITVDINKCANVINWFNHCATTDIKENVYLKKNTTPTTTPAAISTTAAPTPP